MKKYRIASAIQYQFAIFIAYQNYQDGVYNTDADIIVLCTTA